jgi:hypothetical protein
MMQMSMVKTVLNSVRSKISKIKINLNASRENNTKWCMRTENKIKVNLSGVRTSFNLMV